MNVSVILTITFNPSELNEHYLRDLNERFACELCVGTTAERWDSVRGLLEQMKTMHRDYVDQHQLSDHQIENVLKRHTNPAGYSGFQIVYSRPERPAAQAAAPAPPGTVATPAPLTEPPKTIRRLVIPQLTHAVQTVECVLTLTKSELSYCHLDDEYRLKSLQIRAENEFCTHDAMTEIAQMFFSTHLHIHGCRVV